MYDDEHPTRGDDNDGSGGHPGPTPSATPSPSPWSRPVPPEDPVHEVMWDRPPGWAPAWVPDPEDFADPVPTGPRSPTDSTDPTDPDELAGGTGWGRRLVAGILVACLVGFLGARLLAGPNGLLDFNRGTPGAQFIPTQPPTGNGPSRSSGPSSPAEAAVAAKIQPGVVDINTELAYQHATASGTGMVLTSSGQVLTNNHVIEGATAITATVVDTGKTYTATIVGTDSTDDVAVLQLKGASGLDTVPIGDSSTVRLGDEVVALGNAGGVGGSPSIKSGTVADIGQTISVGDPGRGGFQQLNNVIISTVALQSGDSGGPLANADGQVIGIDTAATADNRYRSGQPMGFSIPINDAMAVVARIEAGDASATVHIGPSAFLGVSLVTGNGGALVASVAAGSPAADAGLEEGDTITAANGEQVDSGETLAGVIQAHRPGDKVSLQWTDPSGDSHTATVKLATGPAS